MNRSILIFTFSPIQPFIAEARRPADAYAGSRILSELAKAAGEALQIHGELIYPTNFSQDTPNKLVALLPGEKAAEAARAADGSLRQRWLALAGEARDSFEAKTKPVLKDAIWEKIWNRQVKDFPWEIFWVSQNLDPHLDEAAAYRQAYSGAEAALNSLKRQREFDQGEEEIGQKDSLSGVRQGLLTQKHATSREYWEDIGNKSGIFQSVLRPGERLDAIGLIKRFWPAGFGAQGYHGFPSTSSIASHLFVQEQAELPELVEYRSSLSQLHIHEVRDDPIWPYDGDYLYLDVLRGTGVSDSEKWIEAQRMHEALLKKAAPPTYYAVVLLDGDNMGARINDILTEANPILAHREFSQGLSEFTDNAKEIMEKTTAFPVYLGGDDILFFAPLDIALEAAYNLATCFRKTGSTMSGGIAIVHHTFPLGTALKTAQSAESFAKHWDRNQKTKDALCIQTVKRSGEMLQCCTNWDDLPHYFWEIISWFRRGILSSRFAFELRQSTYFLPPNGPMVLSELRRLLTRHHDNDASAGRIDANVWAKMLETWATTQPGGLEGVSDWVLLARFLAKGGYE